ncbi:MAG: hypothetical protein Kow0099_07350 [Candidatus Abyssubacteria bacterium]
MVRLAHACFAVGLTAALLLSFYLTPDPRGLGTHEQLFLMPCNFHTLTGLPCPFCGMTTAFALMARGEIARAFLVQPMGALSFVACMALLPLTVGAAVFNRNLIGAAMELPWRKLVWMLAAMVALSWLFKIVIERS